MTTTPPQNSLLVPAGTPIHTHSTTTDQYDPKYEDRPKTLQWLLIEMGPYFIGPLALLDFLDKFLPSSLPGPSVSSFKPGMFSALSEVSSKADMYDKFIYSDLSTLLLV